MQAETHTPAIRVMVVEDELLLQEYIKTILARHGFETVAAIASGEEALAKVAQLQPDLVLMDIQLAAMLDGIETGKVIQTTHHIPIIYITAYSDDETLKRAWLTQPYGFLLKPFDEKELYTSIHIALYKHQLENKLRASEEKYRALVENSPDIISRFDEQCRYLYVNPAISLISDRPAEQFIGKSHRELGFPPALTEQWEAAIKAIFTSDTLQQMEWIWDSAQGSRIFDCTLIPEFDAHGHVCTVLSRSRDITQQKIQQEQLIQADKMIALGTLVSGVAHEINNPNNFILLNAKILARVWADILPILDQHYAVGGEFNMSGQPFSQSRDKINGFISGIVEGALRIKDIVINLKDYARAEKSDFKKNIDINMIVKSAVNIIANLIERSTNSFILELDETVPLVRGNFQRLEQVAINLIQNSCEALASKKKKIWVSTTHSPTDNMVILTVHDEGNGIPAEYHKHIMNPFFTTKRDIGGTGLGLSICTRIIEDHGGTIQINSKPDSGTTVKVILPALP